MAKRITTTTTNISNIAGLLNTIRHIKEKYPKHNLFFRGQSKNFPKIQPSIAMENYLKNEDILFKEYILRNPNEFESENSTFEKLVKMQHYKLPTRLLDITSNPLVALFFAVEETKYDAEDGDFIIFPIPDEKIKYYDSDTVSVISNIARRPYNTLDITGITRKPREHSKTFLKRFNQHAGVAYLLHEIKQEKPYFMNVIVKEHLESILCVKPLLKNRRIIKQEGAFLLFGINGSKQKLAEFSDFKPIKIPIRAGRKEYLRTTLELLGFSKDKIYPELDTTAEYLKVKYGKLCDM